jgi:hypothetical protein
VEGAVEVKKGSLLWLWIILGVLALLSGAGVAVYYKVRGLRNNNPGNIKKDSTAWDGLAADAQQTDDTFFIFTAPLYGLRALARILLNYQSEHGLATVQDMINRWAPPVENDTSEYVNNVANAMGIPASQPVDLASDPGAALAMVKAIVVQENGLNPYSDALVAQAIQEAQA